MARLVGISLASVSIFSNKLAQLILREGNLTFQQARAFLRSCYDFLLALELDIPAFQDSYGSYSIGNVWYSYVRSMEGVLSAIMYAARAIGFLLDIATVSFCGAHLEPFDKVYFDRVSPASFYQLACDAQSAAIDLQLRSFQCLEGFLQGRPVWVFSSTEMDYTELPPDIPLYLSTPPDEFANVWGPMWRSVSPRDPEITLRYIVSPGFIIPWRRTPGQPALLTTETHCHWSKDDYDIDSILSQTVHGRAERLLIGANPTLLRNRFCRPDKGAFVSKMSRIKALKELGTHHGDWAVSSINIATGVNMSALLPLSFNIGTTLTKKPPISLRDLVCVNMVAEPRQHLPYLNEYFGVEISACTGNARRVTLANVLGSQTMREYLHHRVHWSSSERDSYFRALKTPNGASAVYYLYYNGSEDQRKCYDIALKLSIAGLADTRVKSSHLRALWAWGGLAYIVKFRLSDHKWAGLLTDTLTTCSLAVVNQTCLECSTRETRHLPTVPIGVPTVFETSLVINPDARLPTSLETIRAGSRLSEGQISRRLREGDTFDVKDHGRVRVLRTPVDYAGRSTGVFVEFVKTFIPARRQTVKNFFQKVARKDLLDTFHREYKDDMQDKDQNWFYVFVVSNSRDLGVWLPR